MIRTSITIISLLHSIQVLSSPTVLEYYRPFAQTNKSTTIKQGGECIEQSRQIKREDAWRCHSQGVSYDPCFVRRFGSQQEVLCMQTPWSSQGITLQVPLPLNGQTHQSLDMSNALPWAIELSTGHKCMAVSSNQMIDNLPVKYQCAGDISLLGAIQRCSAEWTVLMHVDRRVELTTIKTVWF